MAWNWGSTAFSPPTLAATRASTLLALTPIGAALSSALRSLFLPDLLPDRQQVLDRRHGIRKDRQQQLGHRILPRDRRGAGQKNPTIRLYRYLRNIRHAPRHKPAPVLYQRANLMNYCRFVMPPAQTSWRRDQVV